MNILDMIQKSFTPPKEVELPPVESKPRDEDGVPVEHAELVK